MKYPGKRIDHIIKNNKQIYNGGHCSFDDADNIISGPLELSGSFRVILKLFLLFRWY